LKYEKLLLNLYESSIKHQASSIVALLVFLFVSNFGFSQGVTYQVNPPLYYGPYLEFEDYRDTLIKITNNSTNPTNAKVEIFIEKFNGSSYDVVAYTDVNLIDFIEIPPNETMQYVYPSDENLSHIVFVDPSFENLYRASEYFWDTNYRLKHRIIYNFGGSDIFSSFTYTDITEGLEKPLTFPSFSGNDTLTFYTATEVLFWNEVYVKNNNISYKYRLKIFEFNDSENPDSIVSYSLPVIDTLLNNNFIYLDSFNGKYNLRTLSDSNLTYNVVFNIKVEFDDSNYNTTQYDKLSENYVIHYKLIDLPLINSTTDTTLIVDSFYKTYGIKDETVLSNINDLPTIGVLPPSSALGIVECENGGFEDGSLFGWEGYWGKHYFVNMTQTSILNLDNEGFSTNLDPNKALHTLVQPGTDPLTGLLPMVPTDGGDYAIRIGNVDGKTLSAAASLKKTIIVEENVPIDLRFKYALVTDVPFDHEENSLPFFKIDVYLKNSPGFPLYTELIKGKGPNSNENWVGVKTSVAAPNNGVIYMMDWTCLNLNLFVPNANINGTADLVVEFTVANCSWGGHVMYAYIDALCEPALISSDFAIDATPCLNNFDDELNTEIDDASNIDYYNWYITELTNASDNFPGISSTLKSKRFTLNQNLGSTEIDIKALYEELGGKWKCNTDYLIRLEVTSACYGTSITDKKIKTNPCIVFGWDEAISACAPFPDIVVVGGTLSTPSTLPTGSTVTWTPSFGNSNLQQNVTINDVGGAVYVYEIEIDAPGYCNSKFIQYVYQEPTPSISIQTSGKWCDKTFTINPDDNNPNYLYRWYYINPDDLSETLVGTNKSYTIGTENHIRCDYKAELITECGIVNTTFTSEASYLGYYKHPPSVLNNLQIPAGAREDKLYVHAISPFMPSAIRVNNGQPCNTKLFFFPWNTDLECRNIPEEHFYKNVQLLFDENLETLDNFVYYQIKGYRTSVYGRWGQNVFGFINNNNKVRGQNYSLEKSIPDEGWGYNDVNISFSSNIPTGYYLMAGLYVDHCGKTTFNNENPVKFFDCEFYQFGIGGVGFKCKSGFDTPYNNYKTGLIFNIIR
jgi:hypothetical protein